MKAVRSAAEQAAADDDWLRAAALLEGAAREYGADRRGGLPSRLVSSRSTHSFHPLD